jgi:hypothetical protein
MTTVQTPFDVGCDPGRPPFDRLIAVAALRPLGRPEM